MLVCDRNLLRPHPPIGWRKRQVYQHVGRRPICGRCAHTIRDVLRQSPARRLLADNDCYG